ncbi:unnamed protein product [Enterobius vermicularis]|uniref:Hyaluronidase n=1 Tax=Enterobius vermicularis TaxID=51028 RepID=A0A0N4VJH4_ENTVE|nr:unnamed protein product [Enterobius vermicularis]
MILLWLLLVFLLMMMMIKHFLCYFSLAYWNLPSQACYSRGAVPPLDEYGFIFNENHSFYGEKIVTLYSHKFGAYPYYDSNQIPHFGGLPQKANLSLHLTLAEKDFIRAIPSESFDGLAIIDYEEWRPVFSMNWGSKRIYQDKSIEYVYNRTGKISKRMAIALATAEFEKYALTFMSETIQLGKRLRPNAKWGFYGFPYCNANVGMKTELEYVLFPSIYFYKYSDDDPDYNNRQAFAMLNETQRIATYFEPKKQIFAFTKFEYDSYSLEETFYTEVKFNCSFLFITPADLGIDGIIFWSSSFQMPQRCRGIQQFVDADVGPYLQGILTSLLGLKNFRHGKCLAMNKTDCKTYECRCDDEWFGDRCQYNKYSYFVDNKITILERLLLRNIDIDLANLYL